MWRCLGGVVKPQQSCAQVHLLCCPYFCYPIFAFVLTSFDKEQSKGHAHTLPPSPEASSWDRQLWFWKGHNRLPSPEILSLSTHLSRLEEHPCSGMEKGPNTSTTHMAFLFYKTYFVLLVGTWREHQDMFPGPLIFLWVNFNTFKNIIALLYTDRGESISFRNVSENMI